MKREAEDGTLTRRFHRYLKRHGATPSTVRRSLRTLRQARRNRPGSAWPAAQVVSALEYHDIAAPFGGYQVDWPEAPAAK